MLRLSLSILTASLVAGLGHAQGAGPGVIGGPGLSKAFTISNMNGIGTGIIQISTWKLPINPAGQWTACLTVSNLISKYGGTGSGSGVVMGIYDQLNDTFTPNTMANAFNPGPIFGLMLEPKLGNVAVVDSPPRIATRKNFTQPFGSPKPIQGLTASGAPDPSLGYVGGQLKLFYFATVSGGQGIVMQDLDETVPTVKGSPVLVALTPTTGRAHSPTPIMGADGDVEGIFFAENVSSDSDMWLANDLDPTTPNVQVIDSGSTWSNNGGVAGGQFLYAESAVYSTGAQRLDAAWILGDVEKIGGTADITAAVYMSKVPPPAVTVVFMSDKPITALTIPGLLGQFGLNPAILAVLGSIPHIDKTQMGTMSFPLPNDPKLKNAAVAIQGLSIYGTQLAFTNTAWIKTL